MKTSELAAALLRVGDDDLRLAMIKAAMSMMAPRAPTLSDSKSSAAPRLPKHTAVAPQSDQTRPDAIAPQKTIAPPAI